MKVERISYPAGGTFSTITASNHKEVRRGAIVLTPSFKSANTVNVVFYFHGHWVGVRDFDGLLRHRTTSRMMKETESAGKALAIGIPDMGANANNPAADWVYERSSFDSFMEDILRFAAHRANEIRSGMCLVDPSKDHRTGKPVPPLELGNLILAAHSGGGYPLWRTVNNGSAHLAKLKEVWMFDSLYGGHGVSAGSWADWVRKTGVRVYNFYTPGKDGNHATKYNTQALQSLKPPIPRFTTRLPPDSDHHAVPGNHIAKLIRNSGSL